MNVKWDTPIHRIDNSIIIIIVIINIIITSFATKNTAIAFRVSHLENDANLEQITSSNWPRPLQSLCNQ